MYQRRHRSCCQETCGGCLLLILDLLIIAYLAAYVAGLVPHNGVTEFFIEGMKMGMR
jgi:hypothetical protein